MKREEISQKIATFDRRSRKLEAAVVHCSATQEGKDYTVEDIDRWHKERGFNGIGYHFVVYRNGEIEIGRSLNIPGAHVTGHNSRTVGICYIGGLSKKGVAKDTRTDEQKDSLEWLLGELVSKQPTIKEIKGHRDYPGVSKSCPCFDAIPEYEHLLKKA